MQIADQFYSSVYLSVKWVNDSYLTAVDSCEDKIKLHSNYIVSPVQHILRAIEIENIPLKVVGEV